VINLWRTDGQISVRAAFAEEAEVIVTLLYEADPELAAFDWRKFADAGESIFAAATRRCRRDDTQLSFRNVKLAVAADNIVGALLVLPLRSEVLLSANKCDDVEPSKQPIVSLHVPNSLHISTLAVPPTQQRRGIGTLLVRHAEEMGSDFGLDVITLFVRAANTPALRMYKRLGYSETARAVVRFSGELIGSVEFISLVKRLEIAYQTREA
jgi:ribosomal protein S18 acetylase RimI-like enzyme